MNRLESEPLKVILSIQAYTDLIKYLVKNPISIDGVYNREQDLKYVEFMKSYFGSEIIEQAVGKGINVERIDYEDSSPRIKLL